MLFLFSPFYKKDHKHSHMCFLVQPVCLLNLCKTFVIDVYRMDICVIYMFYIILLYIYFLICSVKMKMFVKGEDVLLHLLVLHASFSKRNQMLDYLLIMTRLSTFI